jgi:protein SDA1
MVLNDGKDSTDKVQQSLASLQNKIKRDPEAYEQEFLTQLQHFSSVLELHSQQPQKPNKNFSSFVMFLAHVTPCYPGRIDFVQTVMDCLEKHQDVLHRGTRRVLVNCILLLRRKDPVRVPIMRVLPTLFKLFVVDDKLLRTQLFTAIAKDLFNISKASKAQKTHSEIQLFLFAYLKGSDYILTRRAIAIIISLYYKRKWTDARTVNMISSCALCPDLKVSGSAILFFLGQRPSRTDGEMSDSDGDSDLDEAKKAARDTIGSKKTKGRIAKLSRAKKMVKKVMRRKENKNSESSVDFAAIDILYDPQAFAEKLLQRASKANEPFSFRLRVLQLATRLIGRHQLILLNVYPFLQRYLTTSQRQVTVVLACVAQAIHESVPEEEVHPVMSHIIKTFVAEHAGPEVMIVGLNALAECARRCPLCLSEEQLADVAGFARVKGKGVSSAARGIINMYREIAPERLEKALRGKEATMAMSRGEIERKVYGKQSAAESLPGLELLAARKLRSGRDDDDEEEDASGGSEDGDESDEEESASDAEESEGVEEDEDEEDEEQELQTDGEEEVDEDEVSEEEDEDEDDVVTEDEELEESEDADEEDEDDEDDEDDDEEPVRRRKKRTVSEAADEPSAEAVKQKARALATDYVLSNKDFKKMRKMDVGQRIERQLGRKRTEAERAFDSSSGSGSDSDEGDGGEDERWDMVNPDMLKFSGKRKGKAARLAKVMAGREGRDDKTKKPRAGGSTNREKLRKKPMAMVAQKSIRKKNNLTAKQKASGLKKHIATLKKKVGGGIKRRR